MPRSPLALLGTAMLAVVLLVVTGWAVVGKHHLDQRAGYVYKATRLVVAERPAQPAGPQPSTLACVPVPFARGTAQLPAPCAPLLPAPVARRRPSRAPPIA